MSNQNIPKTAPAVVFEKVNGPIVYKEDHPVTQPKDLKPGEVLVKLECSGVCRESRARSEPLLRIDTS